MNHKWENNKCLKCGIERQKREYKRWQRSETVLRDGVLVDKTIHTFGIAWHYGPEHKFIRPNCKQSFYCNNDANGGSRCTEHCGLCALR